jgi:signal transduction histidine kinase
VWETEKLRLPEGAAFTGDASTYYGTQVELLRFLSHDMRSPQASILALLEMSGSQRDGLDDAERLARIGTYARRTLALADDFVNIARAETLGLAALGDVNLADIAHEASDEAWALATSRRIDLVRSIADEAWVRGDIALLRRALYNLLDNAIKYSPAGATIEITLVRVGDDWLCSVHDQGIGIAPEMLPRLFQRFERAHAGAGPAGVGLGLVLAKTVAQRLGGDLTVASSHGLGSTFTLRIPAASGA